MSYIEHLNQPRDTDEIRKVVITGKRQKAPGSDGLGRDFYEVHWTIVSDDLICVLNQMYWNKAITPNKNTA
jgi:methionine-rich copper-binding protein CopC